MKILAIGTTGALASVAVQDTDKEQKIYYESSNDEMNHLQSLFPMISRVLEAAGVSKADIDLVAVSKGPGSFTGIRIGIAAARTLAQALSLPMAAVPTLESFVYADEESTGSGQTAGGAVRIVCPLLDARRSQVYAAAYLVGAAGDASPGYREVVKGGAYSIKDFMALAIAAAGDEGASVLRMYGDGAAAYISEITAAAAEAGLVLERAIGESAYQNAKNVLRMALVMAEQGRTLSWEEVGPDYMRKSEAERKLAAGQLGKKTGRKKNLKKEQPSAELLRALAEDDGVVSCRAASAKDIDALAALDAKCFTHAWSVAAFKGELDGTKKTRYIAAENSRGEIIGFAGAAYVLDEGEINRVAVHPLFRGRGIAGRMLDELIADAEGSGVAELMLEVREANRSAIALYKDKGFRVEGKRDGYYAETGENALLMRRSSR